MRRWQWRSSGVGTSWRAGAWALGMLACGGGAAESDVAMLQRDVVAAPGAPDTLVSGQSCSELLAAVQGELHAELALLVYQVRFSRGLVTAATSETDESGSGEVPSGLSLEPSGGPSALDALGTASPSPLSLAAPAASDDVVPTSPAAPVPRVDEGDYVKADGGRIYMFGYQSGQLLVLAAEPADALQVLAAVPIEGGPAELLVDRGVVSVFSSITGPPPRIGSSSYPSYEQLFTKLTVVDTTTQPPTIRHETYVEGELESARRHGSVVRATIQQNPKVRLEWPELSDRDIFGVSLTNAQLEREIETWARNTAEAIDASRLEDYLPAVVEYVDGMLVDHAPACESYFVSPGAGLGATTVLGIDLEHPAAEPTNLTVHGLPGAVEIEEESLVVQQYSRREGIGLPRSMRTQLHLFGLDGTSVRYIASGSTRGSVRNLDAEGGVLRATTLEEVYAERYLGNVHHVVTFGVEAGQLSELGRSAELGSNDGIQTAQFLGDRAFVMTSSVWPAENRELAELVVVDVSDPRAPALAGRLQTFGSIDSLLPVSDDRLLGIARGYPEGLAVQLFDVSDPSTPRLAAELVYPQSTTVGDTRAVKFLPSRQLLAFPIADVRYSTAVDVLQVSPNLLTRLGGVAPIPPERSLVDCLGLFGYPTDPDSVAAIEQDPVQRAALLEQCASVSSDAVQNSLLNDSAVYAIGSNSVAAFGLDALSGPPLSQVGLPGPLPVE